MYDLGHTLGRNISSFLVHNTWYSWHYSQSWVRPVADFIFMPCFSGNEALQEEAAICALCLTQPYWLHYVVCYSYYHTNQVRRAHTTVFNYILYFGKIHGGSAVSTEWHYLTAVVPTPYLKWMGLEQMIRTTSASGERCCQGRSSLLSLRPGRNWDTGSGEGLFCKCKSNRLWMC